MRFGVFIIFILVSASIYRGIYFPFLPFFKLFLPFLRFKKRGYGRIEDLVVKQISEFLHDDKLIEDIVHMFMEFQKKENTVIPHLERKLAEVDKAINNMLTAIEQGIINSFTKKRLDELEEKHLNIENEIAKEKMRHPQLTEAQVGFWFERMRDYDVTVLEQRKRLVDTFVNAVFVYNDRIILTFNYRKDAKTVLFSDLKSSDITNGIRQKTESISFGL